MFYLVVENASHEVTGRESPPPEAPPRVQVEGRVAQIKLVLLGDTENPPDLPQCQVRSFCVSSFFVSTFTCFAVH